MTNGAVAILSSLSEDVRSELTARLDRSIDRSGGPSACWPFTGRSRVKGYGVLWLRWPDGRRRMVKVHRVAFELANGGACPPTVDHTCHDGDVCSGLGEACPHRLCCNPAHLAAATLGENARRARLGIYQDECRSGHAMTPENTYQTENGARRCRACAAAAAAAQRALAASARPPRAPRRTYRPRGMDAAALVDWILADCEGEGCWYAEDRTSASRTGYRTVWLGGVSLTAHRLVFEVRRGPIPPSHVVDHTCHDPEQCEGGLDCSHRPCLNPAHLAAVSTAVNVSVARSSRKRPTHCHRGHEFSPENTYRAEGSRICKTCQLDRQREARAAARAARGDADDRRRVNGVCANGHDTTAAGALDQYKRCRECKRAANRAYKARARARGDAIGSAA